MRWILILMLLASGDRMALAQEAGRSVAAARVIKSLIDYTRWPVRTDPLTICVLGQAMWSSQLDAMTLGDGRRTVRRTVSSATIASSGCNAIYLGRIDPRAGQAAIAAVRGKGVLTIAENDPQCRSQAMFCLLPDHATLGFAVNIDAVSRSGLRIDPRVLRMASGNGP